jgi:hypothetical protein
MGMIWFDPASLDDPSLFLLGALEPPLGGPRTEICLECFEEPGPTDGARVAD